MKQAPVVSELVGVCLHGKASLPYISLGCEQSTTCSQSYWLKFFVSLLSMFAKLFKWRWQTEIMNTHIETIW